MPEQKLYDVAVIGGGVAGGAIFEKLCQAECEAVLLEKENDAGRGASSANSGIVHAGYDCRPGTLMAKLNVEGSKAFAAMCERLHVPYKRIGSLVVGTEEDVPRLEALAEQGRKNGVPGLKLVFGAELKKLEPNLARHLTAALYAPSAAIVASYELSVALIQQGMLNGGEALTEFAVDSLKHEFGAWTVGCKERSVRAKYVVNAAGAGFGQINRLAGAEDYPVSYRKGEYYILDKSEARLVGHVVFPLPTAAGKGILALPTTAGNILLGPSSEEIENFSTATTRDGMAKVREGTDKLINGIDWKKVIKIFTGVRTASGEDFVIERSAAVPDFITVGGICSPGLSSCPAIAEYVAGMLPAYRRKHRLAQLPEVPNPASESALNELIAKNPDFGVLMCKCEKVSLGQVRFVMNMPLPPKDVDGLKRRLRVTMGRCQGSFCTPGLINLLKKEARNG